jgi:signal transduction histidine kinase
MTPPPPDPQPDPQAPWRWGPPWRYGPNNPAWHGKRRFMFVRFARFLVMLMILFQGVLAVLAFVFSHIFGGGGRVTFAVWLAGGLVLVFGLFLAGRGITRSFAWTIEPVARVMAAADAVTEGDLSARVPENAPGEFGRLAVAFNRMVAELERTDQQRRNLTADVAHELRTPLHVIQGNLEGILDGVYDPDEAQINLLLDETRQLSRLVEDLRTLSLAEAGQLPLRLEPLSVRDLLEDVATSFSGQAEAAGVDLGVEAISTSAELTVRGDAGRLDQVLSNLVANALRYTPSGGWVRLSAEAVPAAGAEARRVRLRVADNGSGIAAEDLPYIFDRFWRADRARQHTGGGPASTGLGLAIARQLVQAHGGQISVESRPGEGTVFTIELPGE